MSAPGDGYDSVIAARIESWRVEAEVALQVLYGEDRCAELLGGLIARAATAARQRKAALRSLDAARERQADWYQQPDRVGYAAFADRFGGDLRGVAGRIPYLRELGVNVLHLMSVLQSRHGEDDGGYAVADYRRPDPRLGEIEDLERLGDELRNAGISLCLDLVMNHTADDHEWARAARAGSAYHRSLYLLLRDRGLADAYEATLPEVFPEMDPGNFTWIDDLEAWAWTTFRHFQWDLNWSNPAVLLEMAEVVLHLANLGVEILRLDAVAFVWKRLGTDCQNQPEAHLIAQVLRAVVGMAAPATILLAEAIVGPDELVGYLGRHERERRECELAYHNQLMVQGWSMLAERQVQLASVALSRLPVPPARTTWFTYVRCHDDIGWAISDDDAAAVGLSGAAHRAFLAEFYRGDFPGSFARGVPFSINAQTADERTCGMTASLCGISAAEQAGDGPGLERGIARLLLLHALCFGFGGIPVIYMGDELGLVGDPDWALDPHRAADSRWLHRPTFDERVAALRHDPATVPGRVWHGLRALVAARARCLPLHGAGRVDIVASGHPSVFAWRRRHPRFGTMLGLVNVAEQPAVVDSAVLTAALDPGALPDVPDLELHQVEPGESSTNPFVQLAPYQVRWLTADVSYRAAPSWHGGAPRRLPFRTATGIDPAPEHLTQRLEERPSPGETDTC